MPPRRHPRFWREQPRKIIISSNSTRFSIEDQPRLAKAIASLREIINFRRHTGWDHHFLFALAGIISVYRCALSESLSGNSLDINGQFSGNYRYNYSAPGKMNSDFRRASTISVYLVPPGRWRPVRTDEGSIQLFGCKYETNDYRLISDLAEIMRNANINISTHRMEYFEPHEVIYLTSASGKNLHCNSAA